MSLISSKLKNPFPSASTIVTSLTGSGVFLTSPNGLTGSITGTNRYNYLHKVRINNSTIKSGIIRRAFISNSRIYSETFDNSDYKFSDKVKLKEIESVWFESEIQLSKQIEDYADVLQSLVLPCNKFTRRKADLRGSSLHLPGLIKAVISDFNCMKCCDFCDTWITWRAMKFGTTWICL
jgi:hypothetical protein